MKAFRFYDPETGRFARRTLFCLDENVAANTPAGLVAIEGEFDPMSQQVDIKTGKVVDYQPPQPSQDHEWNDKRKRWQLTAQAQDAIAADSQAKALIAAQEAGSARAVRELLLDPTNADAKAQLQAADDAIAAVRPKLAKR